MVQLYTYAVFRSRAVATSVVWTDCAQTEDDRSLNSATIVRRQRISITLFRGADYQLAHKSFESYW